MAKFKVGDKVRVRSDLKAGETYGFDCFFTRNMEPLMGKIVTIKSIVDDNGIYLLKDDVGLRVLGIDGYEWTDAMFENDNLETAKFRAFLEEVANLDADGYSYEWQLLRDIVNYGNDTIYYESSAKTGKEIIDKLCDFYKTFTPKVEEPRKEMTLEQIEAELGYKIKVVE